jgi:hypothetical protein
MKFKLVKKSEGRFHIVNETGDIRGSANVKPHEVDDLLRCWSGPKGAPEQPSSPEEARKAFAKRLRPLSRAAGREAILRSC